MSTPLHLDLLKDEERLSSSPVRLRVLVPAVSVALLLGCLAWWAQVGLRLRNQQTLLAALQGDLQKLKPAHAAVVDLRKQEREAAATIRQLLLYERSLLRFGDALERIPGHVADNIQFTEMRVPPPPPPLVDPKQPWLGPTNAAEKVTLKIAGRTAGDPSYASVNALLAALRDPAFTNLIRSADIPKGAFRQDVVRNPGGRETFLFEFSCAVTPRTFE